ncbi:MAG TPA: hypothetical protein VFW11_24090 [Cyclobacteriaceae bacterium]|nr:hypothetical protein [Cyclobacteriaceae bacterium]
MKNRISYWIAVAVPALVLYFIMTMYSSPSLVFVLVVLYIFVYRPILNMIRLMSLNAIERRDIWKLFIPFQNGKYSKILWLGQA